MKGALLQYKEKKTLFSKKKVKKEKPRKQLDFKQTDWVYPKLSYDKSRNLKEFESILLSESDEL